ncbi:LysR family transcriptional regulator [Myceligenerans crystallogenes]|uniref:LysR family transcriptional regulator n=1 Tax=Myceligenerans crystallogenes TaxID=316335 RepID=A0ABP4ZF75_9MICO
MELDLRHLRMVVAVAESGSVTKAAAVLGIAQPALTAQLNRIDRALGGNVFVRDRNGARSTELGDLVLRHARVLLPAMTTLSDDVRRLVNSAAGDPGALRVGLSGSGLGGLFVNRLHSALPGADVTTVLPRADDDLGNALASGTVEVALAGMCSDSPPPASEAVTWTRVGTDPLFVLLHDGHEYADKPEVTLAELADEQWLSVPDHSCLESCFVSACVRAGFTPNAIGEADWTTAVDQVRTGRAVALVEPGQPDPPGVRAVPLTEAPLRRTHYLGWRRDVRGLLDTELIEDAAHRAHRDAVARSPQYSLWMERHPNVG